ncbi:hypothetical protein LSAT2_027203 [Lamellibrachia satsuma]|nr:hypothetical protein LSAT2_027203 [Lamellibrachia satsuma]
MDATKVLVAVEGSNHAAYALEQYLTYLHKPGNEVLLAYIAEISVAPAYAFREGLALPPEEWQKMLDSYKEETKRLKEHFSDILTPKEVNFTFYSTEGKPGYHLCKLAKEHSVDLIIVGSRGLGTVRRTILGSVSDYVLHHAHVPVFICQKK